MGQSGFKEGPSAMTRGSPKPDAARSQKLRVAVIGLNGTGKTSLIWRSLQREPGTEAQTFSEQTYTKMVPLSHRPSVELTIHDTVEPDEDMPEGFIGGEFFLSNLDKMGSAHLDLGFFIVYSVKDRISYMFAESILAKIVAMRKKMGVEYPVVLLANKVDPPRNITPQLSRETSKDSSTGTGTSVSSGEGSVVSEGGSKKVRSRRGSTGSRSSIDGSSPSGRSRSSTIDYSAPRLSVPTDAGEGKSTHSTNSSTRSSSPTPVSTLGRSRTDSEPALKDPFPRHTSYDPIPLRHSAQEVPVMPRFTSVDETASQKIARLRSEPEAAYSLSSSSSHTNSPMIAVHPTSTSSTPSVAQKPGTGNSPEHGKKPHHHHHHHHHRGHKQPPKAIDLRLVSKEEGDKLALSIPNCDHIEVCSLNGTNVEKAFECMFWKLMRRHLQEEESESSSVMTEL